jgi:ribosomal protein S18 acetylase RimI-like enzyme
LPSDAYIFTPAVDAESELLVGLMQEFYLVEHLQFDEQIVRRALRQILGNRLYGVIHIISLEAEVIGYVALTFGFSLEFHGRTALLDELYVREAFRGRGVGREALRVVEEICRREGIDAIHLEVDRSNLMAQGLYHRAGYRDHDRYLLTKWVQEKC